jgi:hypothetical protein
MAGYSAALTASIGGLPPHHRVRHARHAGHLAHKVVVSGKGPRRHGSVCSGATDLSRGRWPLFGQRRTNCCGTELCAGIIGVARQTRQCEERGVGVRAGSKWQTGVTGSDNGDYGGPAARVMFPSEAHSQVMACHLFAALQWEHADPQGSSNYGSAGRGGGDWIGHVVDSTAALLDRQDRGHEGAARWSLSGVGSAAEGQPRRSKPSPCGSTRRGPPRSQPLLSPRRT